ncbi:endo-1,4-beta-xylanase [Lutibacter flavus]|uniref:Carbohydrate binding domain-containing protein n=1 Tax=Lutibacter flavus TaxID=691689 RepID=A0A238XJI1_9FLAO|nr:endo-1,4-beta-xylanase [Lutibacter flavus]SNR59155.1 Carbohydrate binding domain-containing protein [Lutibacter flavus]
MKYKKIFPILALTSLIFSSCDDQIMEWEKDPSHGEVTTAELPLELAEKITRYDALNTYTDFVLGNGIGVNLYLEDVVYQKIINENFDEVTAGYDMKHGPMVNSNGELNFTKVDAFIAATKEAGLKVFGHTLNWHQNQNASYLNGLIAPTVIPGASGSSSLDLSGLKDGTLNGWGAWNSGDGITVIDNSGLTGTDQAVKMIASATSSAEYNLQLVSPDITVVQGHNYEISFYIKSDQPGSGRISFEGLDNNYPYKDWFSTDGEWTSSFPTTSAWQQVKFNVNDFQGNTFKMAFDLGKLPSVTYYIDINNINVVDLDAEPEAILNLSSLKDGSLSDWGAWNSGDGISVIENSGLTGTAQAVQMIASATSSAEYNLQLITPSISITQGHNYEISFYIKSDQTGSGRISFDGLENNYPYKDWFSTGGDWTGSFPTTSAWTQIKFTVNDFQGDTFKMAFDLGKLPSVTYLIDVDNIIITDLDASSGSGGGSGPIIVEKTDAEKAEIIDASMEDWISKMVGHYKNDVFAWDVVNEPMKEGGSLRDGNVTDLADDEFYWVKYMGEDFAVKAFKYAREYGNANDVLFINDYNLEYSLEKCDGLIEYVTYIESQGATVDGIGTQMHVSLNSDKSKIEQMFIKLAASGKLIKISELDVRLGTNSPTEAQLAEQAEMYRYIMEMFQKNVPVAQQYGVTVWGVSDNVQEHEYWLPDESPNLWDTNYKRKHAYKGVADGLAGKDVSEDFSGELDN